jgi:polyphosphate:AMP phosphotransferase
MFESAELGHKIDKKTYAAEVPVLREALLDMQYDLKEAGTFPVIILVGGVDGAGRSEVVNILNEWMDPRFIHTHGMGAATEDERERPRMWRFWQALPPKGRIGIYFGSWYTWPLLRQVYGESDEADLDSEMDEAIRFEKMLTDEGAIILKFWLHLSKPKQKARLKALEKDPKTKWRVTDRDWTHYKLYKKFMTVAERIIRESSTANAPWFIVEGEDDYYRKLTVAKTILKAIRDRLDNATQRSEIRAAPLIPPIDNLHILKRLDLTQALAKKKYATELEKYQGRLNLLIRHPKMKDHSVIAMFEGNDAAGKGSSIRRITQALDARMYQLVPVAAPTEEERAQPYLWRFWRHLPRRGKVLIFDRSWYGRVLVERVEGYCSQADWMRAYGEINDFEEQMARHGIILSKFWLAISNEEQLARFKAREEISFKRFKITEEDWRNREKWELYEQAVCDMVDRTSTEISPWTLVEANDKLFARIKVLRTLCDRIEETL